MDKVKILIACHKPSNVYQDDVYTPIQVGKALHPELDLGYITDNTGDNISVENPFYCELTAVYWGWKNLDCKYIGLQHYRRYFDFIFNSDNIDEIFKNTDIVLANPLYLGTSIIKYWTDALVPEDVYIALKLLEVMYPDDYKKGISFLSNGIFYPCNMFVCRKELFNGFATWEFNYLSRLKTLLKISSYSREKRIIGFIGEGLLPLYFINRKVNIKTLPVVSFPHNNDFLLKSGLRNKFTTLFHKAIHTKHFSYDKDILNALRADNILDKDNKIIF